MPRNVALGNPVVNPHEDEFNRWPFSRALAEQIAMLGNPDGSPVVGLYGRWGYGKSSVLNFVKYHLEQNHSDNVVLLEFNPWIFKGEEILLTSFYASLAEKMDESLDGVGKKVGDLLAGYSGALAHLIQRIAGIRWRM
jgi:predicted KAP-like P-loop ATPase